MPDVATVLLGFVLSLMTGAGVALGSMFGDERLKPLQAFGIGLVWPGFALIGFYVLLWALITVVG